MISVLIPIYNTDVRLLVNALYQQLQAAGIIYELILLDDKSEESFRLCNRQLVKGSISYIESQINNGRTAVRKLLAQKASYDWLLFMDGDSLIHDLFVQNYIHQIHKSNTKVDVIVGGTDYQKHPPDQCTLHLHWSYGRKREKLDLKKREVFPYYGFTCNNLLIRKSLFRQLNFSHFLHGYGHEDTWIGIQLEKLQARILYIDNPVLHNGIEPTTVFLKKTNEALRNLFLLKDIAGEKTLRKHVKLYNTYCWQKKLRLAPFISLLYYCLQPIINKNLNSCRPLLRLFDLYRLYTLIQLSKQKV